jgi:hypothetical protein
LTNRRKNHYIVENTPLGRAFFQVVDNFKNSPVSADINSNINEKFEVILQQVVDKALSEHVATQADSVIALIHDTGPDSIWYLHEAGRIRPGVLMCGQPLAQGADAVDSQAKLYTQRLIDFAK